MNEEIARRRWALQRLGVPAAGSPAELVRWFGAVQAQEVPATTWALSERLERGSRAAIERAVARGDVLRTHVMRPTWHLVPRDDIRWMIELTAPNVKRVLAHNDRWHGITPALVKRCGAALRKALRGSHDLTRAEAKQLLKGAGLGKDLGLRFWHIMGNLESDGVLCSGPFRGKQSTWALLDERAPRAKALARDEALAELALRYFRSHGPATLQDFGWWSGLSMEDVRRGVALAKVASEEMDGRTYYSAKGRVSTPRSSIARMLPTYDEYVIAYKDRTAALDPAHARRLTFNSTIAVDGLVVGTWKARATSRAVTIHASMVEPVDAATKALVEDAVARYGAFFATEASVKLAAAPSTSAPRAASLFASARPST